MCLVQSYLDRGFHLGLTGPSQLDRNLAQYQLLPAMKFNSHAREKQRRKNRPQQALSLARSLFSLVVAHAPIKTCEYKPHLLTMLFVLELFELHRIHSCKVRVFLEVLLLFLYIVIYPSLLYRPKELQVKNMVRIVQLYYTKNCIYCHGH
jgi:hypothetical protein